MKKLLVLSLVLGIASLATATISLTGPEVVAPSDTVQLILSSDDATATGFYYVIVELGNGPGVITGGQMLPAAGDLAEGGIYDAEAGSWGIAYEALVGGSPNGMTLAGDWAAIDFHCEGPGDVLVLVYADPDYDTPVAQLTISQIPEPATMALLGLGALVLRRKK